MEDELAKAVEGEGEVKKGSWLHRVGWVHVLLSMVEAASPLNALHLHVPL